MRQLIMVFLLVCSSVMAQTADSLGFTGSLLNGRGWKALTRDERALYTSGIRDHIMTALVLQHLPLNKVDWAKGFAISDYIKELDVLYQDGENIRIPVVLGIDYCTTKLRGQTTKKELEELLIMVRKSVAELQ